jgi:hypothetical protein
VPPAASSVTKHWKMQSSPPCSKAGYPATAAVCPHSGAMTKLLMVPLASAKRLVLWYCAFTCAQHRPWSGPGETCSVACSTRCRSLHPFIQMTK